MRIDDMKPGPELDALCHVVMGKKLRRRAEFTNWPRRYLYDPPAFPFTPEEQEWVDKQPLGEWEAFGVPTYSTTWEGLGKVVEEMQRRKYVWRIEGLRAAFFDPYAGSPADDGTMVYAEAIGETAPHAVVLAAIGALQGEDTHGTSK
jgi:hypothetical protein